MFKDLFSNRLFIGVLAFFVLMIVGGILYLQHVERQGQIALERTPEALKRLEERNKKPQAVETNKGGHWNDGEWHSEPHTEYRGLPCEAELKNFASDVEMSKAEIEAFYHSHGLEPPPAGYTYMVNKDGSLELIKNGVPIVEIHSRQGFDTVYLSKEDWTLYQALKGMTDDYIIGTEKIPPEVVEIARERLAALEAKAQGPIFTSTATVWDGLTPPSPEEASRASRAKMVEADLKLGITPELRNSRTRYHYDYELIGQLIAEFKKEIR